jgi:hypothetical protein
MGTLVATKAQGMGFNKKKKHSKKYLDDIEKAK